MRRFRAVSCRFGLIALAALTLFVSAPGANAKTLAEKLRSDESSGAAASSGSDEGYGKLREQYAEVGYTAAKSSVILQGGDYFGGGFEIVPDDEYKSALLFEENIKSVKWNFEIPENALYKLTVSYKSADEKSGDIVRSLKLDGKEPFSECANIRFHRLFADETEEGTTEYLTRPSVFQLDNWQTRDIFDADYMYSEPLQFYLTKGTHTLELETVSGSLLIGEIIFSGYTAPKSYKEISAEYNKKNYTAGEDQIHFEAESENILHKNSNIIRMNTSGDPVVSPKKIGTALMNIIGGTQWQDGATALTWQIKIASAGLYQLAFHQQQSFRDGLPSYRRIEIDGEVPFAEFLEYPFEYNRKWRTKSLGGEDGNPYLLYLDAGLHTVTLTTVQGQMREALAVIDEDFDRLSELTLQINMIVGQNPDVNYDYELEKKIPGLAEKLTGLVSRMEKLMSLLSDIASSKVAMYYQLESMTEQLRDMLDDPFTIPRRLNDLSQISSTYGDWLNNFRKHPLLLDFVEIIPAGDTPTLRKSSFFEKLWISAVQFVMSFTRDYELISAGSESSVKITGKLSVWVARGTDWAHLIKDLSAESFTPETGIEVTINVLPAGQLSSGGVNALLLAIASGRAPDICLATSTESVGEFALRGALSDLTQFDDFDEIKKRFYNELFTPMTHGGGIYGLPETMNFAVMAYRTDILSRLNISPPDTWEDLYNKVIPVLNQNNMQFYAAMNYGMFLFQNNGAYYTDDLMYSALDTPESYRAFVEMCELYTIYGVPVTSSFYNRFRTGESPIGIIDYTLYMTVRGAAAELDGKWTVAPIPGKRRADGTINRAHAGAAAESALIMSQCKNQSAAWEFLKWWTSAESQSQFAYEIEALKGTTARWNSANIEAFSSLAWTKSELPVILGSCADAELVPVVLGGYFTGRHITNAFNRTVVSGVNVRTSLEKAVREINRELNRRRENAKKS